MTNRPARIFLVSNPSSSHAAQVEKEVIEPFHEHAKTEVYDFFVTNKDRTTTAAQVAAQVRPGDRVIVAGGDGTGNAVINGLMQAENTENVTIGFLPYGNFNDMASTFTDKTVAENPLLLLDDIEAVAVHPLEAKVNGEVYQYALLYATIGWTALAAAEFDTPQKRAALQGGKANLVSSLTGIAKMYFQTRHDSYLPAFQRTDQLGMQSKMTDILAINGPIMAKIIRSQELLYAQPDFLSKDLNVSSFFANTNLLAKSGMNFLLNTDFKLPGVKRTSDTIQFKQPSTVPLQIDGEVSQLENVSELTIAKDQSENARVITVLKTTA